MKKTASALLVISLIVILMVAAAPFLVDANKVLKPEIIKYLKAKTHSDVNLENIKLVVREKIFLEIKNLSILNEKNIGMSVPLSKISLSYLSFLKGKPKIAFEMQNAKISMIKDFDNNISFPFLNNFGKENDSNIEFKFLKLTKPTLSLKLIGSEVQIFNANSNELKNYKNINLELDKLRLNENIQIQLESPIQFNGLNNDFNIDGKLKALGSIKVESKANFLEISYANLKLDLMSSKIEFLNIIDKDRSVALNAELIFTKENDGIVIDQLKLTTDDLPINIKGIIQRKGSISDYAFEMECSRINLINWQDVLLVAKKHKITGRFTSSIKLTHQNYVKKYFGNLNLKNGSAKLIDEKIDVDAADIALRFGKDSVAIDKFKFNSGSSNFDINGSFKELPSSVLQLKINSKKFVYDDIFSKDEKTKIEYVLMNNEFLKSKKLEFDLNLSDFKYWNLDFKKFQAKLSKENTVLKINKINYELYSGKGVATLISHLKHNSNTYAINTKFMNIDSKLISNKIYNKHSNFLEGKLSGHLQLNGAIDNLTNRNYNSAKGNFTVEDGKWVISNIVKSVSNELRVIPGTDRELNQIRGGEYFKRLSSNFTYNNHTVDLDNFALDINEANSKIIARGKISKDGDLNLNSSILMQISSSKISNNLKSKDGRIIVSPVSISGTLSEPVWNSSSGIAKIVKNIGIKRIITNQENKSPIETKKANNKLMQNTNAKKLLKELKSK